MMKKKTMFPGILNNLLKAGAEWLIVETSCWSLKRSSILQDISQKSDVPNYQTIWISLKDR